MSIKRKRNSTTKILKRFLFSYSIIIILPLFVGIASYNDSVKIISEDTKNNSISLLSQSMKVLDRTFSEIDLTTYQIANNPQMIKFCYSDSFDDSSIYFDMWKTLSFVKPYSIYEQSGIEYNVYFNNSDTVFNSTGAYKLSSYYNGFGYVDLSMDEFKKSYLNIYTKGCFMPASEIRYAELGVIAGIIPVHKYNVITYFKSMSKFAADTKTAMIFVRIKEDSVLKLFEKLHISEDSCVYVLNENLDIITGISHKDSDVISSEVILNDIDFTQSEGFIKKDIQGETMYITYTVSGYNGWKYVSLVPAHVIMSKVNSIKNLIMSITFASVIVGIILLILLSYANSKPIIELKKILTDFFGHEEDNNQDEFTFLKTHISNLIDKSSSMQSDIEKHRLSLKISVIERLLTGKYSKGSILKLAEEADIDINAKTYICAISNINNAQIDSYRLHELIYKQTGQNVYLIGVDQTSSCLLLCLNTCNEQEYRQYTEQILIWLRNNINETMGIDPAFAIGSVYYDLNDVYHSFDEAKQAQGFLPINKSGPMLWYSNLDNNPKCGYYYPVELEQRLIHLVKYGYKDDACKLLETILHKNMEINLRHKTQLLLVNEIYGTIYKLDVHNVDKVILKLQNSDSLVEIFKYLEDVLCKLCDDINDKKNNSNAKIIEEVVMYIKLNYSDPNICLSELASKFKLSEGYISSLFKDYTGEYFAVYLENLRVDNACNLLKQSGFTINQIALKSGYNSSQSFRRAFKRVKGFNPTDYKA